MTAEQGTFDSPHSQRADRSYEMLEQILIQHPPETPGRPEQSAATG
ncbi:hypothetical protein [Streptomyces sp. NPDC003247]